MNYLAYCTSRIFLTTLQLKLLKWTFKFILVPFIDISINNNTDISEWYQKYISILRLRRNSILIFTLCSSKPFSSLKTNLSRKRFERMEKKRIFRESEENASNSIHQSRQRKCRKRISLNKKKECNAENEE